MLVIGGGSRSAAQLVQKVYKLPFPVLADPQRSVYHEYGLEKVMLVVQRSAVLLVDKQGIVRYLHRSTNPETVLNMPALHHAVDEVQTDEATQE